jgi:hypothetical protein
MIRMARATHQGGSVAQTPMIIHLVTPRSRPQEAMEAAMMIPIHQGTPATHQEAWEETLMTLIPQVQLAQLEVNQAGMVEEVTLMGQETLATHQEVMEEATMAPMAPETPKVPMARLVTALPANCSRRQATCSRTTA